MNNEEYKHILSQDINEIAYDVKKTREKVEAMEKANDKSEATTFIHDVIVYIVLGIVLAYIFMPF